MTARSSAVHGTPGGADRSGVGEMKARDAASVATTPVRDAPRATSGGARAAPAGPVNATCLEA